MAGCDDYIMVCSLNPFYSNQAVVTVDGIEGKWVATKVNTGNVPNSGTTIWRESDSTLIWNISLNLTSSVLSQNPYKVELIGNRADSLRYEFSMIVFVVDGVLYADFVQVSNKATELNRMAYENAFKVHTLAKLIMDNGKITFSWLDDETVIKMIEEKRVRLSFTWINSANRLLLTGSSKQLMAMLQRYAGSERFVNWNEQAAQLTIVKSN
jgi:hypothetical protein